MMTMEQSKLIKAAIIRFGLGMIVIPLMLILPAGTIYYWHAWVYCAVLFTPMLIAVPYLIRTDPELLERRLRAREKERAQFLIILFSSIFILAAFLLPGFDFRFGWSHVPLWLVILSDVMVFFGYVGFLAVLRYNSFAGRTIEVDKGQKVISTGPYALVRHPLYLAYMLIVVFTPLALGSFVALPFFLLSVPFLVLRILNEEAVLRRDLAGYSDYCQKTRYHLIPFVW